VSDRSPPEPLSATEGAALLAIVRTALRATVAGDPLPDPPADVPARLLEPAGVFVTLHAGDLRGCIGSVSPDVPLGISTARMAAAAASRDPRFPPVRPEELVALHIEVSVLSPPRVVAAEDVDPLRDGVAIALGSHRAVLLPQVAVRHGWDHDTLLAELCEKAGLARDAWHDPAIVLYAFTVATISGPA